MMNRFSPTVRCKKCRDFFVEDEEDDSFGTDLCYQCFEEGVEEAHFRRLDRIARENEY